MQEKQWEIRKRVKEGDTILINWGEYLSCSYKHLLNNPDTARKDPRLLVKHKVVYITQCTTGARKYPDGSKCQGRFTLDPRSPDFKKIGVATRNPGLIDDLCLLGGCHDVGTRKAEILCDIIIEIGDEYKDLFTLD